MSEEFASSFFSVIFIAIILITPFFLNYFVTISRRKITLNKLDKKYEEMITGVRQDSKYALNYNSYFLMRRLFLAVTTVFLGNF